jgi:phosphoglycerate dehydrogenase-like enzyme
MPNAMLRAYVEAINRSFPDVEMMTANSREAALPYLPETDVLLTFTPMMSDVILQKAPGLKWIQALGTGVDNLIDLPSLRPDVIVTNMRGIHGAPLTEAAIASMLALGRDLPRFVRNQDSSRWERWPAKLLSGKTVGILGVGTISTALAPLCRAFGMRVIGISSAPRSVPGFDSMHRREDLRAVVPGLDYLVVLAPLTDATRNIVDARVLTAMKPSAFLVNLARGGLVDEEALAAALREGGIAGAALDVFVEEPLPKNHPFWSMKNVIITTHQGGFCDIYPQLALPTIENNLSCFLAGRHADMINQISH